MVFLPNVPVSSSINSSFRLYILYFPGHRQPFRTSRHHLMQIVLGLLNSPQEFVPSLSFRFGFANRVAASNDLPTYHYALITKLVEINWFLRIFVRKRTAALNFPIFLALETPLTTKQLSHQFYIHHHHQSELLTSSTIHFNGTAPGMNCVQAKHMSLFIR